MAQVSNEDLHQELLYRRERLEAAIAIAHQDRQLAQLLHEVDTALARVQTGRFGVCEDCGGSVEAERLAVNPLLHYCLECLTAEERLRLEQDLQLASHIQSQLLPQRGLQAGGWDAHYHYQPLGPVSGDYCDLIQTDGTLFFLLGDVSGKGVAASMVMSQLHAIFRTLVGQGLTPPQLLERANHVLANTGIAGHYATVICGRADRDGAVTLANAGHCPPLLVRRGAATSVESAGLPLGLFSDITYGTASLQLAAGEGLLLYTDGLSEARDRAQAEYGSTRIAQVAATCHALPAQELIRACLSDLAAFQAGEARTDDLTLLAVQRRA